MRFDGCAVQREPLLDMIGAAHHRGPDDSDAVIFESVGLAHKRLAIIDLDARARQPMSYQDRFWIVYNGEIYNFVELRDELARLGHQFRTTSDTEVILAAYAEWGAASLQRFNGMWAFAIFDALKREVFLSRDRFGVKPLMLAWRSNALYFSSEIKQILAVEANRKVNAQRLMDYLLTGHENHTEETFFEGISSLPAGTWLRLGMDGKILDQQSFYQLKYLPEYARMKFEDAQSTLFGLLEDAIRLRLRSDVRVGTCLSGGLDSSAISVLASRQYTGAGGERFLGIHAKSSETSTDESSYARRVAESAGIQLAIVEPRTADFAATLDEVVFTQEEPFGSPSMFMGWHVFREASRQGCRVMLNGQGCDEAFLGYERYFPLELRLSHPVEFARRLRAQASHSKLTMAEALSYYFYFRFNFIRRARARANRYMKSGHLARHAFDAVLESVESYADPFVLQKTEIERLQLPHLLRYEDRNSMRHSIETRLPFLDYRLMEAAASIPLSHKLHNGWTKYVVRKMAEPWLPPEVTWRTIKLGFEAPTTTWLREHAQHMREEIGRSGLLAEFIDLSSLLEDFDRLNAKQKWTAFNVATWARVFEVAA